MTVRNWFDRVPTFIKGIMALIAALAMIAATITGAMAASLEPDKQYILTPSEVLEDTLVVYDIPFGVTASASAMAPWQLLTITDEERKSDLLIISYTIDIPQKTPIDRYQETIMVTVGDETINGTVTIDVQNAVVADVAHFFSMHIIKQAVLFLLFLLFVVYLVIVYNRYMKRKLHKQGYVLLVIFFALCIGGFIIFTQTNVFVKHPGSDFTQTITVTEYSTKIGSIQISRNPDTPITADWVTFSGTNNSFVFYTMQSRDDKKFDVHIVVPTSVVPGVYKYDAKITYLGEEPKIITKKFRVV